MENNGRFFRPLKIKNNEKITMGFCIKSKDSSNPQRVLCAIKKNKHLSEKAGVTNGNGRGGRMVFLRPGFALQLPKDRGIRDRL